MNQIEKNKVHTYMYMNSIRKFFLFCIFFIQFASMSALYVYNLFKNTI